MRHLHSVRPDLQGHLERGLAAAQRVSGLPVAFGGLVAGDGRSFTISALRGTLTTSLLHLRVLRGEGLGGKTLALSRPVMVRDYERAESITHRYDHAVAPERLQTVACLPIAVPSGPRAVLYIGARNDIALGDRTLDLLSSVAHRLATDLRIEAEVARRLQMLLEQAAPEGADAHAALLAGVHEDLTDLARDVTQPDARARLEAVVAALGAVTGRAPGVQAHSAGHAHGQISLTVRETEVLRLAEAGLGNGAIAEALGLLPNTVKAYMKTAMSKFDARNRVQATLLARRAGLLD